MTYYCPSCWNEVGGAQICPACGAEIQRFSHDTYEQKLIAALYHPEPTVPIRAASILGELGSKAAIEPLIEVIGCTTDSFMQEAAAIALGRIGDPTAVPWLIPLEREGSFRVRLAARQAIDMLQGVSDAI